MFGLDGNPCFSVTCFVPAFFFNDTATTEIYTLSLHDALPIYRGVQGRPATSTLPSQCSHLPPTIDRKSTRLHSSHRCISYAVFCLKTKNIEQKWPHLISTSTTVSYFRPRSTNS